MDNPEQIWENINMEETWWTLLVNLSFSLLSTWVLRLETCLGVKLVSSRAWALGAYFLSFSGIPLWYLRPGASLPCSGPICLSFLPFSYPVIHVQYLQWSECSAGIEEHRSYWRRYSSCPAGHTHGEKKTTLNRQWQGKIHDVLCSQGT